MPLPQTELSPCERILFYFFSKTLGKKWPFVFAHVSWFVRVHKLYLCRPSCQDCTTAVVSLLLPCPHLLSYSASYRLLLRRNCGQSRPYLSGRLDSLDHGEADQSPGGQQGQGHLPVETSALRDAVGDVQGLAVPVVGGGRALLALRHHICGHNGRSFSSPPLTLLSFFYANRRMPPPTGSHMCCHCS